MGYVLFNNIPGNVLVPFWHAEFQSGGTVRNSTNRLLLVGQMLATGLATPGHPVMVRDGSEESHGGAGSMIAAMHKIARRNAPLQEIWWLPLADDAAGNAAAGSLLIGDAVATQAETLAIYISGERVRVARLTSDTKANVAANLVAAINKVTALPVTAAVDGVNTAKINLTAKHKGTLGNTIAIDFGTITDDGVAARTLITITPMAGGTGDPDLTAAFANLGDEEFDWIAGPYGDAAALGDSSDLLNDVSGRWSWIKQTYGHYTGTHSGTVGQLVTFGLARNDQHATVWPVRKMRSDGWLVAAAVGAKLALHKATAPELSRPMQGIKLEGIVGPLDAADRLTKTDRQSLYSAGISGYYVGADGSVFMDRVTTTYRTSPLGSPDATYLDVETMAQSMYGIRYLRARTEFEHGRKGLVDDNPAGLPHLVTTRELRVSAIHAYADLVAQGVFEDVEGFARDLVVVRNGSDANRVDYALPFDHVNQFRIAAVAAVNHLQRARPGDALAAGIAA